MKRLFSIVLVLILTGFVFPEYSLCETIPDKKDSTNIDSKDLAERIRRIEEKMEKNNVPLAWAEKITLSGVIEVEAGYEEIDYNESTKKDEDSSDIVIATVEVGIDAEIVKHVSGHILFLYEDDEDLVVDEAIISINGDDVVPLYLNAGQMYMSFGNFESHMISDPITLELGEICEKAVVAGVATDWMDISVGVFNGDIDKTREHDRIESYVASAVFTLPEDTIANFGLTAGASYISNIGDSDALEEDITTSAVNTLDDYIAGYNAFISISVFDKLFLNAEYLTAADKFKAGELSFDGGQEFKPSTWYAELAVEIIDDLEIATRYEASDDCDDLLPKKRYGAVITYGLFENTSLGIEYLHGKFENNDKNDVVTAQLSIEF